MVNSALNCLYLLIVMNEINQCNSRNVLICFVSNYIIKGFTSQRYFLINFFIQNYERKEKYCNCSDSGILKIRRDPQTLIVSFLEMFYFFLISSISAKHFLVEVAEGTIIIEECISILPPYQLTN